MQPGPNRYRLDIRRAGEGFETHGFLRTLALAEAAADADAAGAGEQLESDWHRSDDGHLWSVSSAGATYCIVEETGLVTTDPAYQTLPAPRADTVATDEQIRRGIEQNLLARAETADLEVSVVVHHHRVFLSGKVREDRDIRVIEDIAFNAADVAELVESLDVQHANREAFSQLVELQLELRRMRDDDPQLAALDPEAAPGASPPRSAPSLQLDAAKPVRDRVVQPPARPAY